MDDPGVPRFKSFDGVVAKRLALMGLTGALLVLAGRSFQPFGSRAAAPTPVPVTLGLSLGEGVGGEYRVLAHTTPEGPVYTIVSADGTVLGMGLTREQVGERFPGIGLNEMTADTPETPTPHADW